MPLHAYIVCTYKIYIHGVNLGTDNPVLVKAALFLV